MYKLPKIIGGIAALILLGAGCQATQQPNASQPESKPAEQTSTPNEETKTEEKTTTAPQAEGFNLTAEALGGGAVKFNWTFSGELPSDARFIIVRDAEPNPEHTGNNFWHRVFGTKREEIWIDIPAGKLHFRVCQTDEKEGKCKQYSNDVEVEVK